MKKEVIQVAKEIQKAAYCPYSGFQVGCALLGEDGVVYYGCNVENASYPQGVCAEKGAISHMVAHGCKSWKKMALVGGTEAICVPCGGCLQVLAEFAADTNLMILIDASTGRTTETSIDRLLPSPFKKETK